MTDLGREFCSKLSDELFKKLGVERRRLLAYHPQTNSSAESFNLESIKIMTTMLDVPDDPEWEAWLPTMMLTYNTAMRKATNSSPFFLTYLRDPAMQFFQLGEMGSPFSGEDWATDALRVTSLCQEKGENIHGECPVLQTTCFCCPCSGRRCLATGTDAQDAQCKG